MMIIKTLFEGIFVCILLVALVRMMTYFKTPQKEKQKEKEEFISVLRTVDHTIEITLRSGIRTFDLESEAQREDLLKLVESLNNHAVSLFVSQSLVWGIDTPVHERVSWGF